MLTRLMFSGGGTAQVLVMQAGVSSNAFIYGYANSKYGTLSPNYIYYRGEKYEIDSFYSMLSYYNVSYLYFKENKAPSVAKIVIKVDDSVYTLEKYDNDGYRIATTIFTARRTYKIKILSIE